MILYINFIYLYYHSILYISLDILHKISYYYFIYILHSNNNLIFDPIVLEGGIICDAPGIFRHETC